MCNWESQAIDVINGSKTLFLKEKDSGADSELRAFTVLKAVGHGNSAYVYEAEYLSGGISHRCILKELFPRECGLRRNEKDGVTLYFSQQNSDSKAAECKERYEMIRQRYLNAYRIQNDFKNANHSELDSEEDKMLLAVGVSAPIGLYENEHGILYSVYECSSGFSYDNKDYKDSSLVEILSIIIQTGNVISKYHSAGYIVLDIKESNILITGGRDHRTAIQFDFESLLKREDLKNFSNFSDMSTSLLFTTNVDLLLMPMELKSIRMHLIKGDTDSAAGKIRTTLGQFGERTDIFLLAAVLFRRLFGSMPLKKLRKNNWDLPEDASSFLTMPTVRNKLREILSKALAKDIENRYSSMEKFIDDLRELKSLAVFEDTDNRRVYSEAGLVTEDTQVTADHLRIGSRKHWEFLSGESGKFSQLKKFVQRFNSKVMLEDEEKNHFMPHDVIEHNHAVLLVGDGGMGKSTAVYDYWTEQKDRPDNESVICLYIDLSHYTELHENIRKASEGKGRTVEELPVDLLTYFMLNILHGSGFTSLAISQGDVLNDKKLYEQMTALDHILSVETKLPKYMVILDGYNEILDSSDRAAFEANLGKALIRWKNASFVVTTRAVTIKNDDTTGTEKNNDVFEQLRKFSFVGIPDAEIEAAIMEYKGMSHDEISALKKDKIWEVLKIPMFLNMFLALHTEDARAVHTRGELLDRFILNYEPKTANRISDPDDKEKIKHSSLRKFIVKYSLPFVANYMDQNRTFGITNLLMLTNCDRSWKIMSDGDMPLEWVLDLDVPIIQKRSEWGREIKQIVKIEAGYCYDTSDGKIAFSHQYYRDYFAAKQIQNILSAAKALGEAGLSREEQLAFIKDNGLDYTWSDDVCILLGEIIGDYKNEPGYTEE